MQGISVGAGLAAIGFWAFVAAVVVAAIVSETRKREAQHETLRRMIESGQPIDSTVMDKLLALSGSGSHFGPGMRAAGLIAFFAGIGLGLLGWLIGAGYEGWLYPILGTAALVICVGIGLMAASSALGRTDKP
ncbi:MAG: hypothetical protein CMM50_18155 [Rhodospirillaceae bacterium]|nr:hypothetical protein [Rhodospirillaceae bacterium]|tara:strand:- start:943 stop:1341 length:399 start_codon:yes stop_codon:yes gene_type:complete